MLFRSFDFNAANETSNDPNTCDVIQDFVSGVDKIDLNTIDASSVLKKNNDFVWVGAATSFGNSTEGEVRYQKFDTYTMIYGDTDGDAASEFMIRLEGLVDLKATDFIM